MAEATKTQATPAKQESPIMIIKHSVVDVVAAKVEEFIKNGELDMPKNYSVDNALKAAWLVLQTVEDKDHNKVLISCTRDSIANSLLDMIVQGLNPIKKQCYFISYGKTLTCQRSYFGSMAVAQMVNPKIAEFAYAVVYKGDTFQYGIKNGKKFIIEHTQSIDDVDKEKIVAAYCIAQDKNGDPLRTEIMTLDEIKQAWKMSKLNPFDDNGGLRASSTHGKFTADMALKTVINKCCKAIINASSDNSLLLDRINRNEELTDRVTTGIEIEEEANKGDIIDVTGKTEEAGPKKPDEPNTGQETKKSPGF